MVPQLHFSVIYLESSLCRMSYGGGQVDQRLQPCSEVHHPHSGTKIQEQVPDSSGELTLQLLPECHAAGCVSIESPDIQPLSPTPLFQRPDTQNLSVHPRCVRSLCSDMSLFDKQCLLLTGAIKQRFDESHLEVSEFKKGKCI